VSRIGDRLDGALESRGVRLGGLLHPADLSHVLDGRSVDLVVGRRRIEVMERTDVPAHAAKSTTRVPMRGAPVAKATVWPK